MPRDPRPYVTYPINYTGHPRIEGLSDPAFRVFHEMNDYSRVHRLDGNIPAVVARKRWPSKLLDELVRGIDDRPLIIFADGRYVIRSYAEHQFTTADEEELRTKRAEAGSKGGKAKALAQQNASAALASARPPGWQNVAESKLEVDSDEAPELALDPAARDYDESEKESLRQLLMEPFGREPDELEALTVATMLLEASPRPVGNVVGYVRRCIDRSPVKVAGLCVEAARQSMRVRAVIGGAR